MGRMTYQWNCGYAIDLPNALSGANETLEWSIARRENGLRLTGDIPARLAAYEDTGLEPEEIKELCTDDVAEVAKMFRKMIESGEIDHLRKLAKAEKDGRLVVLPCKVGDTVYTLSHQTMIDKDGNEWYICSPKYKCVIEKQFTLFDLNHIGKTVFLTREEAEAALDGKKK